MVLNKLNMKVLISVPLSLIGAMCPCKKEIKTQSAFTLKLSDAILANFEIKGGQRGSNEKKIDNSNILIRKANCNWIAQMSFAHGFVNSSRLDFDQADLWWGENSEGII
jgi:hypothetical protein